MSIIESNNWNNLPWRHLRPGIEQAVIATGADSMTVTIGRVYSGHEKRPHSHPNEQIALVVSGECDYYVDGVPYHLTAGSWVTVPANVEHYIHVHDCDEPCYQMDIFTPARPEYKAAYEQFLEEQKKAN